MRLRVALKVWRMRGLFGAHHSHRASTWTAALNHPRLRKGLGKRARPNRVPEWRL